MAIVEVVADVILVGENVMDELPSPSPAIVWHSFRDEPTRDFRLAFPPKDILAIYATYDSEFAGRAKT